jgi:Flp pilus assembly pilin Flp
MLKLAKRFLNDEQGLELSEYAVMTALIVAVVVTAIGLLAGSIKARFDDTTATITAIPSGKP